MSFTSEELAGRTDRVRQAFEFAGVFFNGRKAREQRVLCPFHEDHSPSLDINLEKAMFRCRSCGADGDAVDYVAKIRKISVKDAIAELRRELDLVPPAPPSNTRESSLRKSWEIRTADGELVALHERTDSAGGKKSFVWRRDGAIGLGGLPVAALPLYRSEHVPNSSDAVILVEGEKAADALAAEGFLGVGTVTGAGATPGPGPLEILRERQVFLWSDNDQSGREHMNRIATALEGVAASVRLVAWGEREKDDAADFFGRGGTADQLDRLLEAAPDVFPAAQRPPEPAEAQAGRLQVVGADDPTWVSPAMVLFQAGHPIYRVPSPWRQMNEILGGGIPAGGVTTFVGMPDAGKTSMMANIVMPNVLAKRAAVTFLCPDGGRNRLATIIGQGLGFSRELLLQRDRDELAAYVQTLAGLPVFMPDPRRSDNAVFPALKKALARMPPDLWRILVVDSVTRARNDETEEKLYDKLNRMMPFLEEAAERENLVVLASSQWNREAFKSKDPKKNSLGVAGGAGGATIEFSSANLFSITKDETGIRTVTAEKIKDGDQGDGAVFFLRHDRPTATFHDVTADQALDAKDNHNETAIAETMARTCRELRKMRDRGGPKEYPPSTGALIKAVGGNKRTQELARGRLEKEGSVRAEKRSVRDIRWHLVETGDPA